MAHPTKVTEASSNHNRPPPITDGTNWYIVSGTVSTDSDIGMFKATSLDGTWTEQDGSNRPNANNLGNTTAIGFIHATYDSTNDCIWVVWEALAWTATTNMGVLLSCYDVASDAWKTTTTYTNYPTLGGTASGIYQVNSHSDNESGRANVWVGMTGDSTRPIAVVCRESKNRAVMGQDKRDVYLNYWNTSSTSFERTRLDAESGDNSAFHGGSIIGFSGATKYVFSFYHSELDTTLYCTRATIGASPTVTRMTWDGTNVAAGDIALSNGCIQAFNDGTNDLLKAVYTPDATASASGADIYENSLDMSGTTPGTASDTTYNTYADGSNAYLSSWSIGLMRDETNGQIYLVYTHDADRHPQYRTFDDGGSSWSGETEIRAQALYYFWDSYDNSGAGTPTLAFSGDYEGSTDLHVDEIAVSAGLSATTPAAISDTTLYAPTATDFTITGAHISATTLYEPDFVSASTLEVEPGTNISSGLQGTSGVPNFPQVIEYGNALYVRDTGSGSDGAIWKSTDGSTWTEQDSTNHPAINESRSGTITLYDGTIYSCNQPNGSVVMAVFDATTDTWTTSGTAETVKGSFTAQSGLGNRPTMAAARSDGEVIVAYAGDEETVNLAPYQRLVYARGTVGGSWDIDNAVSNTGVEYDSFKNSSSVVIDSEDRAHFFWPNGESNNPIYTRTLQADNSWGNSRQQLNSDSSGNQRGYPATWFEDGGQEVVGYAFRDQDGANDPIYLAYADVADAPSWATEQVIAQSLTKGVPNHLYPHLTTKDQQLLIAMADDDNGDGTYIVTADGSSGTRSWTSPHRRITKDAGNNRGITNLVRMGGDLYAATLMMESDTTDTITTLYDLAIDAQQVVPRASISGTVLYAPTATDFTITMGAAIDATVVYGGHTATQPGGAQAATTPAAIDATTLYAPTGLSLEATAPTISATTLYAPTATDFTITTGAAIDATVLYAPTGLSLEATTPAPITGTTLYAPTATDFTITIGATISATTLYAPTSTDFTITAAHISATVVYGGHSASLGAGDQAATTPAAIDATTLYAPTDLSIEATTPTAISATTLYAPTGLSIEATTPAPISETTLYAPSGSDFTITMGAAISGTTLYAPSGLSLEATTPAAISSTVLYAPTGLSLEATTPTISATVVYGGHTAIVNQVATTPAPITGTTLHVPLGWQISPEFAQAAFAEEAWADTHKSLLTAVTPAAISGTTLYAPTDLSIEATTPAAISNTVVYGSHNVAPVANLPHIASTTTLYPPTKYEPGGELSGTLTMVQAMAFTLEMRQSVSKTLRLQQTIPLTVGREEVA